MKTKLFSFVVCTFHRDKCALLSGNSKYSHNNKTFIEQACSVCTGEILALFFLFKFMHLAKIDIYLPNMDLTLVQQHEHDMYMDTLNIKEDHSK